MNPNYIKRNTLLGSMDVDDCGGRLIKKTDKEKFNLTSRVKVRTFDLTNKEDIADYEVLLTDSANKKISIEFLSRQWSDDKAGIKAYAEWETFSASLQKV